jgi:hypothetical protein
MPDHEKVARRRRRAGRVIAGTGMLWVLFGLIAQKEGFTQQVRLIFDLVALAGFGLAFWLIWLSWRAGRED